MPIAKKYFVVNPVNSVDNNTYSYKNGTPIIKFTLPAQDVLLETSTLKVTGQYQILNGSGQVIDTCGYNLDLNFSQTQGTDDILQATAVNFPNFGGVHNFLEKVVVESKKSKLELVNDTTYGTYASLLEANKYSEDDYKRVPLNTTCASGINADKLTRRMVISGSSDSTQPGADKGQYFNLKLQVGMLDLVPIHLGPDFMGGLTFTLYLASDSQVLFSRYRNIGADAEATNGIKGFSYVLKNVKLTGRYIVPTPQELKQYEPVLLYRNHIDLVNNVHSSVNSNAYTPQVQFVNSIVNLYKRNDNFNNYNLNPINYPIIPGIQEITQSKNGVRFPQDYKVEVSPNYQMFPNLVVNPANPDAFIENKLLFPSLVNGDTEINLMSYKALNNGSLPSHTSLSLKLTDKNQEQEIYAEEPEPTQTLGLNMFPDMATLSADYSMGVQLYQNYMNQDYAIETRSGVLTNDPRLPPTTNNTPLTQTSFVNCLTELNLKNLTQVY